MTEQEKKYLLAIFNILANTIKEKGKNEFRKSIILECECGSKAFIIKQYNIDDYEFICTVCNEVL